jgi:hypothetical protein
LANGTTLRHQHSKGFVTGDEPGNPFDGGCQECFDSEVLAADGSVVSSMGHCQGVDRDGDVWTIWTKADAWGFTGGTGKFKGIEGGGTAKVVNGSPDGRTIYTWDGTIK